MASLWVQEAGRASRNGQLAYAHLLINENEDLKKLSYFVKKSTDSTQIPSMVEYFLMDWNYISKPFTGDCLCSIQMRYFEDSGNPEKNDLWIMLQWFWYSGQLYPAKNIEMEILAVLGCIRELNENGIRKVYGGIIVFSITKNWNVSQPTGFYLILRGSNRNWPWKVSYVRRFAEINNWRVCETSRLTVSHSKKELEVDPNEQPPTFIQHLSTSDYSEEENEAHNSSTSALPALENAASKSFASNSATTF